jgi:phosphoserine phosphatase
MTIGDTFLVVMALIQFIAVAGMAWVGLRVMDTAKRGGRVVAPAAEKARALAEIGQSLSNKVRGDGLKVAARVLTVSERVAARVERARKAVADIRPVATETVAAVRETGQDVATKAAAVSGFAQRLSRLSKAAAAAREAARQAERP